MRRPGDNRRIREIVSAERARPFGPVEVWVQRAAVVLAPTVAYLVTRDWRLPVFFFVTWLVMFLVGPRQRARQLLGFATRKRERE